MTKKRSGICATRKKSKEQAKSSRRKNRSNSIPGGHLNETERKNKLSEKHFYGSIDKPIQKVFIIVFSHPKRKFYAIQDENQSCEEKKNVVGGTENVPSVMKFRLVHHNFGLTIKRAKLQTLLIIRISALDKFETYTGKNRKLAAFEC